MRFGLILFLSFLPAVSALAETQNENFHAGVNTFYRTDLTGDGSKVQIDLELKDDEGVGNLIIHRNGKLVFELFHYDNPQQEKEAYTGEIEKLDFVNLREDKKTEILLGIHESSDGGVISLIEWDGDKFVQTLSCSDQYEFKDLNGDGDQEVITFDRYEQGGPSIYAYDYSQQKYLLATYEYPDYLRQYAEKLEQGKEEEKQSIIAAFSQGGGYVTFRAKNIFRIYYMLGEVEKLRKDFQFFYEEFPDSPWRRDKTKKPDWKTLSSEVEEAQKYLDWYDDPKNPDGNLIHGNFLTGLDNSALSRFYSKGDPVKEYRIRLGLRSMAQKHVEEAKVFYHERNYKEAVGEYQKAIAIDMDDWEAYELMGYACLKDHENDKAITYLEKSIEIDPAYGMGHYNLALAYWAAGQNIKALGQVKKAIKVDPALKTEIKADPQFKAFKNEKGFLETIE